MTGILPQLNTDLQHTTTLPILKKKVSYRPFFVKEEKILLMAMEGEETTEMYDAILNVLSNCTFGKLNINTLSIIDVEWLMVQIRIRSKGEISEVRMKCKNKVEKLKVVPPVEEICNHITTIGIDLTQMRIDKQKDHNNVIHLTKDIGLKMKYPTMTMLDLLSRSKDMKEIELSDEMLIACVESVFYGDKVYLGNDVPKEELIRFFDSMTDDQYKKVKKFFSTMPKVKVDVPFVCAECGHKEELSLEGIKSFFG